MNEDYELWFANDKKVGKYAHFFPYRYFVFFRTGNKLVWNFCNCPRQIFLQHRVKQN